ncbi:MAG: hypothetical protein GX146_01650 [Myxococcales bacterium]|jgi:type IV pilus assembly protein PilZ|nr:hypothetical protein [Myxococcales bacterium]
MRNIVLTYAANEDFLSAYLSDFDGGGLFVPTEEAFTLYESIRLRVLLPTIPDGIELSARIRWIRPRAKWKTALPPGIGIEFDLDVQDKVAFLLAHCSGAIPLARKAERRVPVTLRVVLLHNGRRIPAETRDISRGGMALVSEASLQVGDFVELELYASDELPPELFGGHVTWTRPQSGQTGLGLKFAFPSPFRQKRVQFLLNKILGVSRPPDSPFSGT